MIEMGNNVATKLDQSGLNVDARKPPEPDQPVSNITQRAFGPSMKPSP
jgi:hypothetical protein